MDRGVTTMITRIINFLTGNNDTTFENIMKTFTKARNNLEKLYDARTKEIEDLKDRMANAQTDQIRTDNARTKLKELLGE